METKHTGKKGRTSKCKMKRGRGREEAREGADFVRNSSNPIMTSVFSFTRLVRQLSLLADNAPETKLVNHTVPGMHIRERENKWRLPRKHAWSLSRYQSVGIHVLKCL